jgi:transcriptional regulator with XRE-family HTH domain
MINLSHLRAELARRGVNQTQLAARLGIPPTTLSGWLRQLYPGPDDLRARIEAALGLETGALDANPKSAV